MEESPSPEVTTRSAGTRYGTMLAGISIVVFLALTFAHVDQSSGIGRWAMIPLYLLAIYLAQKFFMDNGNGFMSYGEGMGVAFWIALIHSAIYSVFFYIYIKFIDSSFVEMIKQKQMEEMQNRGMSDEQIDQAIGIASMFLSPGIMFFFSLIGGLIGITICGLIVTMFTQKSNSGPPN